MEQIWNSERIKHTRMAYGWSQKDLADRLGVTDAHISMIESGLRSPSNALIKKMAKLFRVRLSTLLAK